MIAETIPALADLSPDDKILLAVELWQDAVGMEADAPDPVLVEALRERLNDFRIHADGGSSWEDVRKRLILRKNS